MRRKIGEEREKSDLHTMAQRDGSGVKRRIVHTD